MSALPPDYDSDPARWASHDRNTYFQADIHEMVASRIVRAGLHPVLDMGCGDGRLQAVLPDGWPWIGIDASPTQLSHIGAGRVAVADAAALPFTDGSFVAVTALSMLYHLHKPTLAIAEAYRVLRPNGYFFACTSARNDDPELTDGYPPTTFDAEEAPDVVQSIFGGDLKVITWNAPLVRLPDRSAVARYLRSHLLPATHVDRVVPPVTLTKRGCLVIARRP